ncbi:MAG TPA: hypothetical protein VH678_25180 [Xanthobacteraceae bacterium]|jgi:hypothetical protein
MNDSAVARLATAAPYRRGRIAATFRLALELVFLFMGAVAAKELLANTATASYPNLLWLPVAVLTLQNGLASGLAAAAIATALQYAGGLPPELLGEDIYSYIGRIAAEPIAWTCFALMFGHIRSRQIAHAAELEAQLVERNEQCAAVADLCDDLRRRIEVLERQIAAAGHASNADMAEAVIELHHADWDDFADRLRRFVVLMTGCADFAIHLLRGDSLTLAFPLQDDHRSALGSPIVRGDALFEATVVQRRLLSARQTADAAILDARAVMAGPISTGKSPEAVIGMFSLGGASAQDCPDDLARRFSLALSELSRLSGHLALIQRWQAAAAGISNGHASTRESDLGPPHRGEDGPAKPPPAEPARQMALQ